MYTGADVARIRQLTGQTQEDFAKSVGTTGRNVSRWEHAPNTPIRNRAAQILLAQIERGLDATPKAALAA